MILLLLLVAAPERVVVVAKPAEKPGFFHKVGEKLGAAARRLYQRTDPDVDEGNELAAQNDPEGALKAYDRALERLPDSAPLHLNRANQLLKLGSDHAMRAHDEAKGAMQTTDRSLKARGAFDLALSYEALGNPDEAIKSYQETLALDPDDRDAKVNLELLLKSQEERKQKQPQQQQESKENKQDQQQQQPDKNKGQQQQQQQQQKEAGDKKQQDQQQQQQQAKQEQKKQQQQAEEKPVDRSEAERLLDALRAGEKNLQVWRFAKEKNKEARRGDVEKDW